MAGLLDDWMNQQPTAGGLLNVDDMKRAQQMGLFGGLGRVAEALMMQGQPSRTPGGGIGSAFAAFPGGYAQAQGAAADSAVKQKVMGQQFDMNKVNLQQAQYNLKREQDWYGGGQTQMVGTPQPNGEIVGPAGPAMGGDVPGATPASMGVPRNEVDLLNSLPPAQREAIRALGPVAGPKALADLALKQMETNEWENAEQGGIKGQRNKRTGKFEAFPASALTDQYTQEVVNGVNMQRNTRTNKLEPLDPTPRNTTNVNLPATKQRIKSQEIIGEMYGDALKADFTAPVRLGKIDRLESLLDQTYTGGGGELNQTAKKSLKASADALGMNSSFLDGPIGAGEAAKAMANEMALQLRNPASGAGMPGAMSEGDREFLVSMIPGLSTTPEGRKMMFATMRAVIQRERQVTQRMRDYASKHDGTLDEGFFNELAQWSDSNPLFPRPTSPEQAKGLKRGTIFLAPDNSVRVAP